MRYLKTYKLFESNQKTVIEEQISDILVDIKDDGFDYLTFITTAGSFGVTPVCVNIYLPSEGEHSIGHDFVYGEIKNSVSHLSKFLEEEGYRLTEVSIVAKGVSTEHIKNHFGINIDISDDRVMRVLKLSFEIYNWNK